MYGSQCAFVLWVDHEAAAKEWLKAAQFSSDLETPTKAGTNRDGTGSVGQSFETPFTKAKRKAVTTDNVDDNTNDDQGNDNANANGVSPLPAATADLRELPERTQKATKVSAASKPGQSFIDRLQGRWPPLPTPESRDQLTLDEAVITASRQPLQRETSPTPARFHGVLGVNFSEDSDLITKILELVRADNPKLKASTEMQLRHEAGLAIDMNETKLRRCDVTISELQKRVDELETMVYNLT